MSKVGAVIEWWSVWDSRNGGRGVFQARYGFSKVSSVSMVGGCPVSMGIDIVNPGGCML
jgi:hypothetical protein